MSFRRSGLHIFAICLGLVGTCAQVTPVAASAQGSFQRTLKVTGPVYMEITTGSGNVDVHTGDSSQVLVTGRIRVTDWFGGASAEEKVKRIEANPPVQQSGNNIRIGHLDDPWLRRNVSISYEVVVPAETQLRSHTGSGNQTIQGIRGVLDVESGSGNLQVSGIGSTVRAEAGSGNIEIDKVNGNVRAKTGSGTIRASGVGGGFEGEAGSGNIKLEQTAPGAVRAETGSGEMELRGVRGSLEATAGSGNIHADGAPAGMWRVHTGSGGVRLRMDADSAFDLEARTGSGSIRVNQALQVQGTLGRKEIQGKVRGGGVPVKVETGSGSIQID